MPTTTDLAARLAQIVALQQEILSRATAGDEVLMQLVVDRMIEIGNATAGVIELVHGEDLVYRAASGPAHQFIGAHIPMEASLSGTAIRQKEVLTCNDTEHDPRVDIEACRDWNIHSMIAAPLMTDDGAIGALLAYSDRKGNFNDLDSYAVQLVAGITSAALRLSHQFREHEASEERYRSLFENNVAGVFRTTLDGRILDCNQAFVDVLGYGSREEIMERRAGDLYAQPQHRDILLQSLQKERAMKNVRLPLKRKDGSALAGVVNIGFVPAPPGGEVQLIGTVVEERAKS
jgi:PAS domain S-box-containing protein